jgi:hypothetical protein
MKNMHRMPDGTMMKGAKHKGPMKKSGPKKKASTKKPPMGYK